MKIPLIIFFFLLFALTLYADVPELKDGVYINNAGAPLQMTGNSCPFAVDWNNDGKKDLLVGESPGYIWLFLNQGTDLNPVFNGGSKVECNSVPIKVTYI